MRKHLVATGLAVAALCATFPAPVKADEAPLKLSGAIAAFQEMVAYVLSWDSSEHRQDFCIGLRVSPEPVDHPDLGDLPEAAFNQLQATAGGRADLHPASQCVIFGDAAAFKGRDAVLLSYWDIDTDFDENLRARGLDVPEEAARSSFEPNRLAPSHPPPYLDIRPDGRMRWDGFGQVGDACGPRYYDFSGDAQRVRILHVFQHPEIC
jgi:hypothetical protein